MIKHFRLLMLIVIILFFMVLFGACNQLPTIIISFDSNGGVEIADVTVTADSTLPIPIKDGYTFTGWYNDLGFPITAITLKDINVSQTLTAHWEINTYTLSFDALGGTADILSNDVIYNSVIENMPIPEKTGYNFNGWYTEIDGGNLINAETIYNFSSNISIYAHWSAIDIEIFFNSNGGNSSDDSTRIISYNTVLGALPQLSITGYVLLGWFTEIEGGVQINENTLVNFLDNRTYYARWISNEYNIYFDYQGADESESNNISQAIYYNSPFGELPLPVKAGYAFGGWHIDSPEGILVQSNSIFSDCLDVTLFAQWLKTFHYTLINDEIIIIGYTPYMPNNVVIPKIIDGHIVRGIASGAFRNSTLSSIIITSCVTSIGEYAFENCVNLTSIIIPNSVITIDKYAFNNCSSLVSVNLSRNLINISNYAFSNCNSITNIVIPDSLNYLGKGVFNNCTSLVSIELGAQITRLYDELFYNCKKLQRVDIPDSVTVIDEKVFYDCNELSEVNLGNSLKTIGDKAFWNCYSLTELSIPKSLKSIGWLTFFYCVSLERIEVDALNNYFSSENNVLYNKNKTALIVYPAGSLEDEFTIPSTVIRYEDAALANCFNLLNIYVEEGNTAFTSIDGVLYSMDMTVFCVYPIGRTETSYDVSIGVITLSNAAFAGAKNLVTINLPENLIDLGMGTFFSCDKLTDIEIPDSVETLGYGVFNLCISLTDIILPVGITGIPEGAFSDCINLVNVTVSEELTFFGRYSFNNCVKLTNINMPASLNVIVENAFSNCGFTDIILPYGLITIEDGAFSNCENLINISISESVVEIGKNAFDNCSSLTSLYIPDNVTIISDNILENCNNLIIYCEAPEKPEGWVGNWCNSFNIEIPIFWNIDLEDIKEFNDFDYLLIDNEVTMIRYRGNSDTLIIPNEINGISVAYLSNKFLSNNSELINLTLPDSLIEINEGALSGCNNLVNLTVPFIGRSITATGAEALLGYLFGQEFYDGSEYTMQYYDNYSLRLNYIPVSLSRVTILSGSVLSFSFSSCRNITEIIIPDSIIEIGNKAFYECTSLESLTTGNSIERIGDHAFANCNNLVDFEITDSVNNIGVYAFYNCGNLENSVRAINLTEIGAFAFFGCANISEILLSDELLNIGEYCFSGCQNITEIIIPDSIINIPFGAFKDCTRLSNIIIGSGVSTINTFAFYNCSSLESIIIPDNVTEICGSIFDLCGSISDITLPFIGASANAETYDEGTLGYIFGLTPYEEGVLIGNRSYIPAGLRTVNITNTTIINNGAFAEFITLTDINLPEMITSIGNFAFMNCRNLTKIIIPDNVSTIGMHAFEGCSKLSAINIPLSVQVISEIAFNYCDNIIIYCEAESIPEGFSSYWNFSNRPVYWNILLENIKEYNDINYILNNNKITITMYNGYEDNLIIPEKINDIYVNTIGGYAFYESSIISIDIPQSVTKIDDYCFMNSDNLVTVNFMEGSLPYYIGKSAFENCTSLENIVIPYNSISNINERLFYGCSSIRELVIPYGVHYIFSSAFYNCTSLLDITIPNSVYSIGNEAFMNCSSITEIALPDSLVLMENNVFAYCTALTTVTIERPIDYRTSESYLGTHGSEGMFRGCTSLTTIYAYLLNGDAPVYEVPLRPNVLTGVEVYKQHPYWRDYQDIIRPNPNGI